MPHKQQWNLNLFLEIHGGYHYEALRAKDLFQRHVDSVLQKCGKLRSLVGDLQKNYPEDPTAKKTLGLLKDVLVNNCLSWLHVW